MSSNFYYGDSTNTTKKEELASYIEKITTSLSDINDIDISDKWKCAEGTKFINKFTELKSKINSIVTSLESYTSFLGLVNTTYTDVSDEIKDALSSYGKGD